MATNRKKKPSVYCLYDLKGTAMHRHLVRKGATLQFVQPSVTVTWPEDSMVKPMTKGDVDAFRKNIIEHSSRMPYKLYIVPSEIEQDYRLEKYWYNRFTLFSKYNEGIKLDKESWYSVTPEEIASSVARKCRSDVVIDAFCGAGGNAIQFAFTCKKVIALDVDPAKIELARHNARVYGVEDRIEFIVGDFAKLAPNLKGDVVFLAAPWGGISYKKRTKSYNLNKLGRPLGGERLYEMSARIVPNVMMYLPRNIDREQVEDLAGPCVSVHFEEYWLNEKIMGITAYFRQLSF